MEGISSESFSSALSFGSIAGSIVFGGVGLWMFNDGRKNSNFRHLILGLVLMVYPLFIYNSWAIWGFGAAVSAYAYYRAKM
jgi:hypothetical protein